MNYQLKFLIYVDIKGDCTIVCFIVYIIIYLMKTPGTKKNNNHKDFCEKESMRIFNEDTKNEK